MKTLSKRKPGAARTSPKRGGKDDGAPVAGDAIRDASGNWSAGLRSEAHAGLVGRIAGLMPQIDALMGDLTARLMGVAAMPGGTIFRAVAGDAERVTMLRALVDAAGGSAAEREDIGAAIASYAMSRRRWRAYLNGLWYTRENGRTYLAAPDGNDAATFLVAREVKQAELTAELARLTALGGVLPRLGWGRAATPTPEVVPQPRRRPEAGKAGRAAPKREAGMRGRRAPRWGAATISSSQKDDRSTSDGGSEG